MTTDASTYRFPSAAPSHMHEVFAPRIIAELRRLQPARTLDLGCGNGSLCRMIKDAGFTVQGADPSADGVRQASQAFADIAFIQKSVYDEPPTEWLGAFDAVVSTEVIEHLYNPRALPAFIRKVLKPGGTALITTPYHGYWKNLALSLLDQWDTHHTVSWEHGHIKFFSRKTLAELFEREGFQTLSFQGLGRFPFLWKTMLMTFRAPTG